MISRMKLIFWISLFLLQLACSSNVTPSHALGPNKYGDNLLSSIDSNKANDRRETDAALSEAAVSVSNSLNKLAEIQQAVHPQAKLPPPPNAEKIGMADLASVDWTGPIEPLVRKIAAASQYRLRVLGHSPAIPIIVSITAKDTQLADLLRDIGFQSEQQASLVLYPSSRVIELRYRGA